MTPCSPRTTYYYRDLTQILSRHEIQGTGRGLQYFYHYDALGNVSAWTNQSGHEDQEYMYAPYGRPIDNNGPDNSSTQTNPHTNLAWAGKPWDQETALSYYGARDYDPAMGTWLTQDPYPGRLKDPVTWHRYGYVNNNPTTLMDPYGYSWLSDRWEEITNWWSSRILETNAEKAVRIAREKFEKQLEKEAKDREVSARKAAEKN